MKCNGNKKIHLAHVIGYLGMAGMELGVIRQSNALSGDNFDISIVYFDGHEDNAVSLVEPSIKLKYIPRSPGFDGNLILRLARYFRGYHVDIVHSHNWTTFLYAVLAARLASVPVIIHGEHGRETEKYDSDWKSLMLRKYLARHCDHLTTVSSDIASKVLQDVWKVPSWKVSWIPNGVLLNVFKPSKGSHDNREFLKINTQAKVIGTVVGTIRPVKDLPTLLKAFSIVHESLPGTHLLIVGYGSSIRQLQQQAQRLRILERVHFVEKRSDISTVMAALDVYVNCSLYEGMSNTILEAMACGAPVVATAVGGTPSIVQSEYNGLLVPPKDPKKMSEAIIRLLADRRISDSISTNARKYVETHHNFETTIDKYKNLYLHWFYEKKRLSESGNTKRLIKKMLGNTCKSSGILRWRCKFGDRPIYIINYHRILPAHELRNYIFPAMVLLVSVFERQMDFLSRNCNVISLDQCVDILRNDLRVPERAVVLTFDDGYQEIYSVVRPILEKYGLPATVCVAVGGMRTNEPLWYDDLAERLQRSDLSDSEFLNGLPSDLKVILKKMKDILPGERAKAIRNAIQTIILLDHDQKMSVLEQLLKIEPDGSRPNHALLSWDMVKALSQSVLFTFGSHGVRHVPLDLLCEEELDEELQSSKQVLEQCVQKPVSVFSYPWGRFNEGVKNRVIEAGYLCALTLSDSPNYRGQDLFEVRRVDAAYLTLNHFFHDGAMVAELSGFNHMRRSLHRTYATMRER